MRNGLGLLLGLTAWGCHAGGEADDGSSTTAASSSSSETGSHGATASSPSTTTDASAEGSTTAGSASDASSSSGAAATSAADDSTSSGLPDANGCPAAAPSSWIGCEDFDAIDDPAAQLPEWNVFEGAFGVEPDGEDPGDLALRITLTPGLMFGGWVTLRFGEGPDAGIVDSPEQHLDEVWVRYSLRTGEGWPGYEIGDVGEVIVMNGPDWAIAAEMAIRGDASMRLRPLGWTCIFDDVLACNGSNEWSGALQLIWQEQGTTTLFDAAGAGHGRCVEAHMRLNTPGAVDGEAQVWVDGIEEISTSGVDFRGSWSDFGINALRFTNFAEPPAKPLDFWVDDVVIASERVGCD